MTPHKKILLGLTEPELIDYCDTLGEAPYRGKQLFQWLYTKRVRDFSEMTDIGKPLRSHLTGTAHIGSITLQSQSRSSLDGTTKFLFQLEDGLQIESVLIPPSRSFRTDRSGDEQRATICVSTQVGCPLDCTFCATATMGYRRNLTVGEIVDQIIQAQSSTKYRITNVVFMGMGEPLMNYDRVMKAVEIIATGIKIAVKRITISTAGWTEGIRRLGVEKRRIKLAVSLHAATDEVRSRLMPVNIRHPLAELLPVLEEYYTRTRQRITYEYIFFDGINDTPREVQALVKLARRIPSKINVIPFHPIDFAQPTGFASSLRPSQRVESIVASLRSNHLTVMVRSSAGEDIDAACGQLVLRTPSRVGYDSHNRVARSGKLPLGSSC